MKPADPEMQAWLALAAAPGIDAALASVLVGRFGSAAACLEASTASLAACGLDAKAVGRLRSPDPNRIQAALRWREAPANRLVTVADAAYPAQLRTISDAPVLLFVAGDPAALAGTQVAIVGGRRPTPAGRETAFDFAAQLSRSGLVVTSGLAAGIDAAAHRGALAAGGQTVAVCGTGLDQVYPAANSSLAAAIADQGALVSEFPPGSPPRAANFPRRNRLISGLALGVVVVEAAYRSGSLITARLAAEQGREVFALPGSVHNPMARGCHRLIRDGARLVETPGEVLQGLQQDLFQALSDVPGPDARAPADSAGRLDSDSKILLNACGFGPVDADVLVERTGFSPSAVASMLLLLELRGEIEPSAGGSYCRLPARPR